MQPIVTHVCALPNVWADLATEWGYGRGSRAPRWRAEAAQGFGNMTMPGTLIAAALLLLSSDAEANAICRWVDEAGRTRLAEGVPDTFRKGAFCSDSQRCERSPEQREAAEQQIKARRPAAIPPTDCATWWRIYDESVECFGLCRTTRGATKVEAFDQCNVISSPEPKCGPGRNGCEAGQSHAGSVGLHPDGRE